jgi:transcriptional regulator with XRE-family HTH domain
MHTREMRELDDLAAKAKFTQSQVAAHMGISSQYWYSIRRGTKPISEPVLKSMKELCGRLRKFSTAS